MAGALKGLGTGVGFLLKHPIMSAGAIGGAAHLMTGGQSTEAAIDGAKDLASGGLKTAADSVFGGLGDSFGGVFEFFKDNPLTSLAAAGAGLFGAMKGGWLTGLVCAAGAFAVSYLAQKALVKNDFNTAASSTNPALQLNAAQLDANKRIFDPEKIANLNPKELQSQAGTHHTNPPPEPVAAPAQGPTHEPG